MILECDIGNTHCKWRLLDAQRVIERGVIAYKEEGFAVLPRHEAIARVRAACVAGSQVEAALALGVQRSLALECEFARSEARTAGLENCYAEPERMGVDRWSAAVAAFKSSAGDALVLDVGSALNIELVSQQGRHLGGYIVPGIDLMKQSLLQGTDRVRFEMSNDGGLDFGCSTVESVNRGAILAVAGAARLAIDRAAQLSPSADAASLRILLTGGGARYVEPYLPQSVETVPDLVMDGLSWLLP